MLISITDLFKKSLNLYKNNFKIILKYVFLITIPTILSFLISLGVSYSANLVSSINYLILFILVPLFFILFLIVFILGMWFNFALTKEINNIYTNNTNTGLKNNLNQTKHLIWKGFVTSVVSGLYASWPFLLAGLLFIGKILVFPNILSQNINKFLNVLLLLLFIAGSVYLIFWVIRLTFAIFETILKENNFRQAINNSKNLTKNRWWSVALRIIIPSLIIYIFLSLISTILSGFGQLIGNSFIIVTNLANLVLGLLVAPISLIIVLILYHELNKSSAQE